MSQSTPTEQILRYILMVRQSLLGRHHTGRPLTMATYAIGILPLILCLKSEMEQIWYADDSSAGGTLSNLRSWWERILKLGPDFGYFVNVSKSVMIVKEDSLQEAEMMFEGSGIQITTAGGKYLGAVIGKGTFKKHL